MTYFEKFIEEQGRIVNYRNSNCLSRIVNFPFYIQMKKRLLELKLKVSENGNK